MKKRIAITAAIALLAILSTMCFAACEQAITADEAMKLLSDSIAEAKAQSGYFVKYKTFFSNGETEEYRLYVKGIGTESVAAAYDHTVDKVVSTSTEYLYWGAASQVKEDKKAEDVVKTGMLSQAGEGNNKYWVIDDTITPDDFLARAEVAPYTLDAICAYIEDCLTADKMTITSAKTKGWVDYAFVSEVKDESSPLYGCKDIELRATKDRLSTIYFTNAKGEDVQINIVYGEGRVLNLPQWK